VVAFRDIDPRAPTHVLLIPTAHHENVSDLADDDPSGLLALMVAVRSVAESEGIAESGYRIVSNTGAQAGQAVFHAHVHLIGGRPMGWPPG
jgi:histidine triad (HIT) family protein